MHRYLLLFQLSIQINICFVTSKPQSYMPPKKDQKAAEQIPKEPEPEPLPHELVGYGKFQYINGAIYEGAWKIINQQKMKHGFGKLTLPTLNNTKPESYEGDWFEDRMQGYGTYYYPDGSIYRGEWNNNKHNGKGIFEFANGTKYEGSWKDHLMEGHGEYTDHLNRKWRGEFRRGLFDSRAQRDLIKQISIEERKKKIKEEVAQTIQKIIGLIQSKQTEGHQIGTYFERNSIINQLARCKAIGFNAFSAERWLEILKSLKVQNFAVLNDKSDAKIVNPNEISTPQMQGLGQIVETHGDGGHSIAFMQINPAQWIIIGTNS